MIVSCKKILFYFFLGKFSFHWAHHSWSNIYFLLKLKSFFLLYNHYDYNILWEKWAQCHWILKKFIRKNSFKNLWMRAYTWKSVCWRIVIHFYHKTSIKRLFHIERHISTAKLFFLFENISIMNIQKRERIRVRKRLESIKPFTFF